MIELKILQKFCFKESIKCRNMAIKGKIAMISKVDALIEEKFVLSVWNTIPLHVPYTQQLA